MSPTATTHQLNLCRKYFDLVVSGAKSIEVRVKHPHLENMSAGARIVFAVKESVDRCTVDVVRVTEYTPFEALLDGEGAANVNPTASREQQLSNIRGIYGPEKEALGALTIEIKLTARGRQPDGTSRSPFLPNPAAGAHAASNPNAS
ncbi:ASCH domain-containing protein [Streptomyces sp. NPDC056544]|uniref:ASCH domain-containing protein n=1 Tax=unclassified Streptomyces TaxID=2593676 RepID=UPI00368ED7F0